MKFTAKTEYGVRAIMQVASNRDLTQVREISKRQNIPERFLEQVMALLKKSGLIESVRGASGGYLLSRPADNITLADIIEAIEGPITVMECLTGDDDLKCGQQTSACVVREVWKGIQSTIAKELHSITLANLVEKERKKQKVVNYDI